MVEKVSATSADTETACGTVLREAPTEPVLEAIESQWAERSENKHSYHPLWSLFQTRQQNPEEVEAQNTNTDTEHKKYKPA